MKPTPPKRILIVVAVLLALLLLMFGAAQAQPVQVVDDRGQTVVLAQPPQRIVSLLPSLAETVCALGACGRLVGVDRYTNWPASVQQLPQVGGGLDPNIEMVVALRPDLVLMSASSRAAERLRALGVPVAALEPKTHADVQRVITKLGQLLGVDGAQQVWQRIDAAVDAQARSLPPQARGLRVYFEVSPGPFGAGEASFIGQTLARLGARNVLPASLGPFPKINPEFVVRADPDVVMVGARSADGLLARPGWSAMRALRQGHVCVFNAQESDMLIRPGPRMDEGARLMADCLRRNAGAAAGQGAAR
ncbi:ABC transporter substrate-binding protein [Comamonas faecalis]|uniref:ABC transporter substrate-binding protein n=1 Tax=Comamonas faecalis TaxID=1387849 RepID=A0ABP7QDQ0_9BURK